MKKLIAIGASSALLVSLTGCAGSFDLFQKAYSTCGSPSGIQVQDEGKTIIIDGNGEDEYYAASISDTACVLNAVGTPSYILSNMDTTNAMMGRQTATFGDKIDISWSYHPDNGLDIVIHKN